MSSPWTHAICAECYAKFEPGREPVRTINMPKDRCCWCGRETSIYYRYDPNAAPCRGTIGAVHARGQ